jgi:hypothetical protein
MSTMPDVDDGVLSRDSAVCVLSGIHSGFVLPGIALVSSAFHIHSTEASLGYTAILSNRRSASDFDHKYLSLRGTGWHWLCRLRPRPHTPTCQTVKVAADPGGVCGLRAGNDIDCARLRLIACR